MVLLFPLSAQVNVVVVGEEKEERTLFSGIDSQIVTAPYGHHPREPRVVLNSLFTTSFSNHLP